MAVITLDRDKNRITVLVEKNDLIKDKEKKRHQRQTSEPVFNRRHFC